MPPRAAACSASRRLAIWRSRSWDSAGRVVYSSSRMQADREPRSYKDEEGNLVREDGKGNVTVTTYLFSGEIQVVTFRDMKDVLTNSYAYGADGSSEVTTRLNGVVTKRCSYDAEGRRTSTTDRAGRVTTIGYDKLGRISSTTKADGAITRSAARKRWSS